MPSPKDALFAGCINIVGKVSAMCKIKSRMCLHGANQDEAAEANRYQGRGTGERGQSYEYSLEGGNRFSCPEGC